jgi:surface carbohydrate biosynthesis protein (TIGR04326 family)
LAMHRYFPEVTILGFQHSTTWPFLPIYTAGKGEIARCRRVFPDRIICNGAYFLDNLKENGFPGEMLQVGPALRYLYLGGKNKVVTYDDQDKVILVCLPLPQDQAVEVLHKTVAALAGLNFPVALKAHPMSDRDYLLSCLNLSTLPEGMQWVSGAMNDWLPRARCMLASSGAVVIEAILAGIPTVIIGSEQGLEMNALGWWQQEIPMFRPIYGLEKITTAVHFWLAVTREEQKNLLRAAQDVLSNCFQPWDEALWQDIFQIHG